jgi:hypothetical protein
MGTPLAVEDVGLIILLEESRKGLGPVHKFLPK